MSSESALISIVVPVHNVEQYLERCVKSIVNSIYTNFELLLVENGSSDKSYDICLELKKNESRIKVFRCEKADLSSALNYGIEQAMGEYIAMVDSDDTIEPTMLSSLIKGFDIPGTDIVMCDYRLAGESISNNNSKNEAHFISAYGEILNCQSFFELMQDSSKNAFVCCCVRWNKLYRKSLFDKYKYPEGHINEDNWAIHYLCALARNIVVVPSVEYNYFVNSDSIMNNKISAARYEEIYARVDRVRFLKQLGIKKEVIISMQKGILFHIPRLYFAGRYSGVKKQDYDSLRKIYADVMSNEDVVQCMNVKEKFYAFLFIHLVDVLYGEFCLEKYLRVCKFLFK